MRKEGHQYRIKILQFPHPIQILALHNLILVHSFCPCPRLRVLSLFRFLSYLRRVLYILDRAVHKFRPY